MKMHCKSCGCHFDDDFEETLEPECTMWKERGFAPNTTESHKRIMWNAYFSMPVDAIAEETGVVLTFDFRATPGLKYTQNEFMAHVPGYDEWTDRERRDFQKRYFKFYYNQPKDEMMTMYLKAMGELND